MDKEHRPIGSRVDANRAIVSLLTILAVTLVLAGTVTAANGGISVDRNEGTVDVTINRSQYDLSGNEAITVSVRDVETNPVVNFTGSGEDTLNLPLDWYRNASGDLSSATVNVTVDGKTHQFNDTDLRYLSKGGPARTGSGDVVLPVDQYNVTGIPTGTNVQVDVNDSETKTTVTGTLSDDGLRIPIENIHGTVSMYEQLRFQVNMTGVSATYQLDVQRHARAYVEPKNGQAVVQHPLMRAGQKYDVHVETSNPTGTFSKRLNASSGGTLELPAEILYAETLGIQIRETSGTVVYNSSTRSHAALSVDEASRVRGTWNDSGDVDFRANSIPSEVTAVWVEHNGTLDRYSADLVSNGSFLGQQLDVDPGDEFTALVVGSERSQVISVGQDSASEQSGSQADGQQDASATSTRNIGVYKNLLEKMLFIFIPLGLGALAALTMGLYDKWQDTLSKRGIRSFYAGFFAFGTAGGYWIAEMQLPKYATYIITGILIILFTFITFNHFANQKRNGKIIAFTLSMIATSIIMGVIVGLVIILEGILYINSAIGGVIFGYSTATIYCLGYWEDSTPKSDETQTQSSGTAPFGGAGSQNTSHRQPTTYETTIHVRDATGASIPGTVLVDATKGLEQTDIKVIDDKKTVDLEGGEWEFTASHGQNRATKESRIASDGEDVVLEFEGKAITIEAIDRDTNEPIKGAQVSASIGGSQTTGKTNRNGKWEQTVSLNAESVSIDVDADGYEEGSWSTQLNGDTSKELPLRPMTGTLEATVSLNGTPVSDVPVKASNLSGSGEFRQETDSDGTVTFTDVRIGEYSLEPVLSEYPSEFSAKQRHKKVRDGKTTSRQLAVSFSYSHTRDAKDRIESLRDRVDDIATVSRRDGAIPEYYASVLHATVDCVEQIPTTGAPLMTSKVRPRELTEELLEAIETATDGVDDVLTSKRNVDLFSACSDLPAASVQWSGSVSVDQVIRLSQQPIPQQLEQINQSHSAVDNRISEEVGDLAEVSPAREMCEMVSQIIRDNMGDEQLETAVNVTVAEALLDGIEGLFETEALRQRMERTVY